MLHSYDRPHATLLHATCCMQQKLHSVYPPLGVKVKAISCFCGDLRKFSQQKSIFKQLDTALVGMVHWVTTYLRKFSPRKSVFKQLDTVLVGMVHWVTTYSRKFFPRKSVFKQFAKVFSGKRKPLYGNVVLCI